MEQVEFQPFSFSTFYKMEHSTSAPNERVLRTTQLAKLSFNPTSVVLTFFNVFIKYYTLY